MAAIDCVNSRRQIEPLLAKALRSKGNLLVLARCADQLKLESVERRAHTLVARDGIVTDIDRGRALWNLIGEAIERLRPADSERDTTPAWRLYAVAQGIYLQGKSAKALAAELNISPRTFHRGRQDAVQAIMTVVWQFESQTRVDDVSP